MVEGRREKGCEFEEKGVSIHSSNPHNSHFTSPQPQLQITCDFFFFLFLPTPLPCTGSASFSRSTLLAFLAITANCPMILSTTSHGNMFHSNPFNSSSSY
eukprot:TRINITY_DN963_c0_g1_i5.p2 TRINITY_DN963_c0_g1~~TRINITY_DN963_c0_g1_i5.p2  ORF type:complete len:100 (+),score=12.55 TRINITY_DN963_c0_g1_i5:253-552(+)